jgi:very-short-patch-repair endonuclease
MELATRQHGVVSTRQLKTLGYGRNSASKAARVGRLHRVHRGVYAVGHTDLTWHGCCVAAVLACAPAVASHWTAGRLWGLVKTSSTIHITVPTKRRPRRAFRLHLDVVSDEDVTEIDRIPVTSLARTHLDLAATAPARLPRFLHRSEELKLFDLRAFESLLERCRHHRGYAALDEALRIYRPEAAVLRSNLERDFRRLLGSAGIPLPAANATVAGYELDCYWEAERFCVELDTFGTHGSRLSFEEDRKRQRELRGLGIELERVTDKQLQREPDAVLAAVAASLRRRRG